VTTTETDLPELAGRLGGSLVLPDDPEFAALRKPVLGQLEEVLPQAVARCATAGDVAEALSFARARGLPFAVRSGGHSFADFCTTSGLLIDLGQLASVEVDGGVATVGPGVRVSVLADRLAEPGRMVPFGWCPTVAVGGSVLGGGYGMLSRRYGLGCDHLLAAQVVLAGGRAVWTDEDREPELFWALRGAGGGNFGVVTALVLRTHPAPRVTTFVHRWPWRAATDVIDAWQRWAPEAPAEVNAELVLATALPPDTEPRVVLFGAVVGRAADARPLLEAFIARADPGEELEELTELSVRAAPRRHTYAGVPQFPVVEPGPPANVRPRLRAMKSEFFTDPLPREAIEALVANFAADPLRGQYRELELVPWGGALRRVPPQATAFVHRDPRFLIGHHGIVAHRASDRERQETRDWVRRSWEAVHPWGSGAVYPNYPDRELAGWARAYYGANLPRLSRVKARYDPENVFHFAQSVPLPDGAEPSATGRSTTDAGLPAARGMPG
jgi:FAD/FMN-containing dehydrogenase